MRVKSYRAATSTDAFALVRADLGDDAVILSNKCVRENGREICEIMAAVENEAPVKASGAATRDDVLDEALGAVSAQGWQHEWGQIKKHLIALMKPQMNTEALSPRQQLAMEYLEREGVESTVLMDVFRELAADPKQTILPVLRTITRAKPFTPSRFRKKFHALAGPHGAGKTSATLRLALREKKSKPKARVCVVSADDEGRGRMILRHYAELSGLAYREIVDKDDYGLLVKEAHQFDKIFIDLPALSGDETLSGWLARHGMEQSRELDVHLVLNPYYCAEQYHAFAKRYETARGASVIWTKLDEACTFGALVNTAHATGLPISALSYGAGLRNSMTPASEEHVWRLVFKHQLPGHGIPGQGA